MVIKHLICYLYSYAGINLYFTADNKIKSIKSETNKTLCCLKACSCCLFDFQLERINRLTDGYCRHRSVLTFFRANIVDQANSRRFDPLARVCGVRARTYVVQLSGVIRQASERKWLFCGFRGFHCCCTYLCVRHELHFCHRYIPTSAYVVPPELVLCLYLQMIRATLTSYEPRHHHLIETCAISNMFIIYVQCLGLKVKCGT